MTFGQIKGMMLEIKIMYFYFLFYLFALGRYTGTCVLLEEMLGKNFLYLACRHHVHELILRSVVEIYWKGTSGPNVAIFQRFQQNWNAIDKTQFTTGMQDKFVAKILSGKKDELLAFIDSQFKVLTMFRKAILTMFRRDVKVNKQTCKKN